MLRMGARWWPNLSHAAVFILPASAGAARRDRCRQETRRRRLADLLERVEPGLLSLIAGDSRALDKKHDQKGLLKRKRVISPSGGLGKLLPKWLISRPVLLT
jgi:hypothetical protein